MLALEDQTLLSPRLKTLGIPLSEYSFANLFLFRKKHENKIVKVEGEIFIQGKTYDGLETLMPTVLPNPDMTSKIIESGRIFYPIPEQWLDRFPKESHITNVEADNDYLHKRESIATYAGRALSAKRNLVGQFEREYEAEILPLTLTSAPDAIHVVEQWIRESDYKDDTDECKEALKYLNELSLLGSIIYVNKKPIAFHVGEMLTNEVYIVHFAKGSKQYKGVYPYMYQQLAKSLPNNIEWLNFEQDLGLPNLRQAKHSFEPDHYGVKFRISKKS